MKVNELLVEGALVGQYKLLEESISMIGESAVEKAVDNTQVKFYQSPVGDKSFAVFEKNKVVFFEDRQEKSMTISQWNEFEKVLVSDGYKEERGKGQLRKWTPFILTTLKWVGIATAASVAIAALVTMSGGTIPMGYAPMFFRTGLMALGKFKADIVNGKWSIKTDDTMVDATSTATNTVAAASGN